MQRATTHRTRRRLATAVLAPVAALGAWGLIRLAGIELVLSDGRGTVGAADVVTAALAGALGGWLVVSLVERRSRRPRTVWPFVATTALSISMIGPTWLADGESGAALIVLHFVVAIVVIAGYNGTLPVCCRPRLEADPAR